MEDTLRSRLATKEPAEAPQNDSLDESQYSFLKMPNTIQETGLSEGFLAELLLKILYTAGSLTGFQLAGRLMVSPTVVNNVIVPLKKAKLIDESKGTTERRLDYVNTLTTEGRQRVRESLTASTYAGPCPVPLSLYIEAVEAQALGGRARVMDKASLKEGLGHLIVDDDLIDQLGPAVNSWRALFIYGPPGNGKTAIAEAIGASVFEAYYLPHAIAIDSQVIKVFDPVNHEPLDPPWQADTEAPGSDLTPFDPRWIRCRRPVVFTGGELTLAMLDLAFNPLVRYYEAPLQLKANGGILLVDDFGRQMVSPRDLLNRWIIPMEHRRDYLTLHTGQKFAVPFDIFTIFGTNIEPQDLVDEAFLRRIPNKVQINDPTPAQFHRIFAQICMQQGLEYDEVLVENLIERQYRARGRNLRACHPRDLAALIVARASFLGEPAELTEKKIEEACKTYFVD